MLARSDSGNVPANDARRASATAQRFSSWHYPSHPPPHGPNKYVNNGLDDKRPDVDPLASNSADHIAEPYVKLGRLSVLAPCRKLSLSKLLINSVFDFTAQQLDAIYVLPSLSARELAALQGPNAARPLSWQGLVMIHVQAHLKHMWKKLGFREEMRNDNDEIEIPAGPHWMKKALNTSACGRG